MPRKRLIYEDSESLLKELIEGTRTLNSAYLLKFRSISVYNDIDQHNLISDAISLYLASKKIKNLKF
ncbi:hypothetical protein CGK37_13035 [Vibrio parahaemolyticus]|nr:hypothetical protein CGK37_13035 [Vibrio parahaemolyticus]TOA17181.1 hypothetical protein CGK34_01525 [Vibrio parahaemolyticus]TOC23389.1 hypothetical protein CGJ88_25235 [Vibrio parahaemolyticus]